jgi:hypothetical protein
MISVHRLVSIVAALILLPFIYGGCVVIFTSGDTDDKDEEEQVQAVVLAPAGITAENAVEVAAGAIAGGPAPERLSSPAAESSPDPGVETAFRSMQLPAVLADALGRIAPDPAVISFSRSDVIEEIGAAPGSCGGQFSYRLDFNRVTEKFSGGLNFEDYCMEGAIVSNASEIEGLFSVTTGDIVSARLSFEALRIDGLGYDGTLEVESFDGVVEAYLTIDTSGDGSAEGYALSGYFVDIVPYPGFSEVWISGTYGHPAFGAVELETIEPFIVYAADRWPSSGVAVVTGKSATAAALTAVDVTRFRVSLDAGGDGRLSRYLGMHAWE